MNRMRGLAGNGQAYGKVRRDIELYGQVSVVVGGLNVGLEGTQIL